MYTEFYKLSGRPFKVSPDYRFYFGSRSHKKAMAYLTYGIGQGEGFIIITGDVGAGKTTLVGQLFSQLDAEKFVVANLVTSYLEADDVLRAAASALGIDCKGADKAGLLRRFEDFLIDRYRDGKRVLLVVDEVQNMPISGLEELRMLSNFQLGANALLQCFLLGQPQLRRVIAQASMEQLRQRVIASYHLEPLSADETRAYVEHRLGLVGWENDPCFSDDAFAVIHQSTEGVPRRINNLCTRLLLFGCLEERHDIDAAAVREVVGDLAREGTHAPSTDDKRAQLLGLPGDAPIGGAAAHDAVERIDSRLAALEYRVRLQGRTIGRALEIATNSGWIDPKPEPEVVLDDVNERRI